MHGYKSQGKQRHGGEGGTPFILGRKGGDGPTPWIQIFGGGGGPKPFIQVFGGDGPGPLIQVFGGDGPLPLIQVFGSGGERRTCEGAHTMDFFLTLLNEANRIVVSAFPNCEFYEASGKPANETGSHQEDVPEWRFVFNHPMPGNKKHTVFLYFRDGQFDSPQDNPFGWFGDEVIQLPIELGLAEAIVLKDKAGYTEPFSSVGLNWAVAPGVEEPRYIFASKQGLYIFVGVYSKLVTAQPMALRKA